MVIFNTISGTESNDKWAIPRTNGSGDGLVLYSIECFIVCVKYPPRLNIKKGDGIADLLMVSTYNLTETGDKGITMVSLSERHSLRGHRNNT